MMKVNDILATGDGVVLLALLIFAFAVLSKYVVPLVRSRLTAEQRKDIAHWVSTAVQAAEEAERSGLIDRSAKYDYAVKLLERVGVHVDADVLRGLIDAACWELFNQFRADDSDTEDYTEGR